MAKQTHHSSKNVKSSKSEWIDISIPLNESIRQTPGEDYMPHIKRIRSRERGDKVVMQQIFINSHNGTHVETPYFWYEEAKTIDEMPLDTTIGPARVIEIKDPVSIKVKELKTYDIQPGERLLFKTQNSSRADLAVKFYEDNVYFTTRAAHFLAQKKVRLVGLDAMSVGNLANHKANDETHQIMLQNNIYLIEDIDLSKAKPGRFELICLPLRLEKGEASPARAIIRPI
jgi:arylformamidase